MKKAAIMVVGVVLVVLASVVSFIGIGEASDQTEKARAESIVSRFHPADGWVQDDSRVTGDFLCSGAGNPCNSILRGWTTDHQLNLEEFLGLIKDDGWDLPVHGNCRHPGGTPGLLELCSAQGIVDSYSIRIALVSEDARKPDRVSLRIVKVGS